MNSSPCVFVIVRHAHNAVRISRTHKNQRWMDVDTTHALGTLYVEMPEQYNGEFATLDTHEYNPTIKYTEIETHKYTDVDEQAGWLAGK